MTVSASDLRAQIKKQTISHFEGILPESGHPTLFETRRKSLIGGVEIVLQAVPASDNETQASEEYFLTLVDKRVTPPRVHAFHDGLPLGALACESLDSAVATEPDARSLAEWQEVDSSIGQSIATYVLFMLDPSLHPPVTAVA